MAAVHPQEYLDFLESLVMKVHRIVIVSIATVHTMAHAGKQVSCNSVACSDSSICVLPVRFEHADDMQSAGSSLA